MESNDVELLLKKYYNAETSEEEENDLKKYFSEVSQVPMHLKAEAALFKAYTTQQQPGLDKFLDNEWLFEKIHLANQSLPGRRAFALRRVLTAAASVILIAGAFLTGLWYKGSDNERMGEVANLQQGLHDMKQVLIANRSPSDRIKVVSQDFDPVNDKQMIDVLIATINGDPNVNVRLAACGALYQFKNNDKAKQGFIQSLQIQTDPMIQIFLIEILSEIKEKESFEVIERFYNKGNLLPAVRKKAEEGLTKLREV